MEEARAEPVGEEQAVGSAASRFEAFYEAEYAGVVRLAYASTGRMDLAEELAQEAFLAAYRRWRQVDGYEDPGGWVRRVVINRSVSAWRRRMTEASALTRVRAAASPVPPHGDRDVELWATVRALPRRQAQVLLLIAVEDRSVAQIAELLAISENSVRTHLRRAREALAQRLPTPDEEAP